MNTEIQLPSAHESEAAVLACLIEQPKRFSALAWEAQLCAESFDSPIYRKLWEIISTRLRDNRPVDPASLKSEIQNQRGALSVSDLSNVLLSEYHDEAWPEYIETLRDRQTRRIAITAGREVQERNEDGQSAIDRLRRATEAASAAMNGTSHLLDAKSCVSSFLATIEERAASGTMPGLATGIEQIDSRTGGMRPGEFWVFGAKTSMGKSVIMLQIAEHVLTLGKRVAIFSLEMGSDEVIGRIVSCGWRVPIDQIMTPRKMVAANKVQVIEASNTLQKSGLMVCDRADLTVDAIAGHCQRVKDAFGLDLIIVDYLQLVSVVKVKGENREQEVAGITRALKRLAKRLKCPVVTATQLNNDGQARESRAIEHDADAVMLITPKDEHWQTLQFWKCRNSKRGEEIACQLNGLYQKFTFA